MTKLEKIFDSCNWDSRFEYSTPEEFDQVFETGEELAGFLNSTEEEGENGFWQLHLGQWSNGQKVVAVFCEFEE